MRSSAATGRSAPPARLVHPRRLRPRAVPRNDCSLRGFSTAAVGRGGRRRRRWRLCGCARFLARRRRRCRHPALRYPPLGHRRRVTGWTSAVGPAERRCSGVQRLERAVAGPAGSGARCLVPRRKQRHRGRAGSERGGDELDVGLRGRGQEVALVVDRQRCQVEPAEHLRIEALSPAGASEITRSAPPLPGTFRVDRRHRGARAQRRSDLRWGDLPRGAGRS